MPKQLAKTDSYKELVKKIRAELNELEFFVKRQTAQSYWNIGKFIHEHILRYKDRAEYRASLLKKLAKDVDRDESTLDRALKFYRLYPISGVRPKLGWEHYRRLITIPDKSKRLAFEKKALQHNWTGEELKEAIRLDRLEIEDRQGKVAQASDKAAKLSVTCSRLFTYRILEPNFITAQEGQNVVDLGFSNNIQTKIFGVAKLKTQEIIETAKSGDTFSFRRSDAKPKELYTYVAQVERVVDGDTLWLNIDCGLRVWTRQKVRLRGIDTPELSAKNGIEAKEFIEAELKGAFFVVIKTHKSDKYDRYLTDVFYLTQEAKPNKVLEEGIFLNQELLDNNLAGAWNP